MNVDARNDRLAKAGLLVVARAMLMVSLAVGFADAAVAARIPGAATPSAPEYSKPINGLLNPTGRPIAMSVPLKDGRRELGEISVRILPDDTIMLPVARLTERLQGVLAAPVLEQIRQAAGTRSEVSLAALKAIGIELDLDRGLLELVLSHGIDKRPESELSLARPGFAGPGPRTVRPAGVSGFLNVYTGLNHVWRDNADEQTSVTFDLQSSVRVGDVVLENDGIYDGTVDTFLCPIEAQCTYDHRGGLKRRRSRAVYDLPERQIRLQLGDTMISGIGPQRTPDMLGLAVEHAPRRFADGRSLTPTGQGAFRVERSAEVDVLVNGVILRRFSLRPGTYNLRDLPLGIGANDVEVVITDETGQRRTLAYSTFIDHQMLAAGRAEWSAGAGVPSTTIDGARSYRRDESFASGFMRYGLTNALTGEVHAQADDQVRMGGASAYVATPLGVVSLESALSSGGAGLGHSQGASWGLANFKGALYEGLGARESLRVSLDYRSTDFRSPGERLLHVNGILFPQYPYRLRLRGDYSIQLGAGLTAMVSARYQLADPNWQQISPLTFRGNRYGADLTLSKPLTRELSGAVTLGYSNESSLRDLALRSTGEAELRAMVRLHWRTPEAGYVAASHDTLSRHTQVSAWQGRGHGVGRWETSVDTQHTGYDDRSLTTASMAWYGNRAEVRAQHAVLANGSPLEGMHVAASGHRTSLRVGTAIAFADGVVGIGAPVRGDAFALVYPHASLEGRTVTVGTADQIRATSDGWGPAVVSNVPAHAGYSLPVDVPDLPIGYSLGSGTFDLHAPYKAGYALEVGSGASVTAYGTLVLEDGSPAGLLSGEATSAEAPGLRVEFFTNAAGRFGVEGVAPGKWRLALAAEDQTLVYEIEVPKSAKGLFRAGTSRPVAR